MTANLPSGAIDYEIDYELVARFTRHALTTDQIDRCDHIRSAGLELARLITATAPASDERSAALNRLDEAVMQANAAIARRELRG